MPSKKEQAMARKKIRPETRAKIRDKARNSIVDKLRSKLPKPDPDTLAPLRKKLSRAVPSAIGNDTHVRAYHINRSGKPAQEALHGVL